jgi:hypothetical protein
MVSAAGADSAGLATGINDTATTKDAMAAARMSTRKTYRRSSDGKNADERAMIR